MPGNCTRGDTSFTPGTAFTFGNKLMGSASPSETLLPTYNRSLCVLAMACLMPELSPCRRPNNRKALTICRSISTARLFLRQMPAQTNGRYFMSQAPWDTPGARGERGPFNDGV